MTHPPSIETHKRMEFAYVGNIVTLTTCPRAEFPLDVSSRVCQTVKVTLGALEWKGRLGRGTWGDRAN